MKYVIGLLVLAVGGWAVAAPYATAYQMKQAADAQDDAALSAHVEFDTLRENLKVQLNARMADGLGHSTDNATVRRLGALLGGAVTDRVVERYVTPGGIAEMMRGESPKPDREDVTESGDNKDAPFSDVSLGYQSWSRFHVTAHDDETARDVVFVLERRGPIGMRFKLTNIILPAV